MSKARGLADLGNAYSDGALSNRNRLINGAFNVNQRGVSGTVTLSAGDYGHDRWKAGASGCTYTFATSANVTTITISAGSLVQVIEGINLQSGTHILSWSGTVQMSLDGGSAGSSGVTATLTGGTNATVETSGTGTLSLVQLELGDTVTPFEHRSYTQELHLRKRYYTNSYETASEVGGAAVDGAHFCWAGGDAIDRYFVNIDFDTVMRATPTVTYYGGRDGVADTANRIARYNGDILRSFTTDPSASPKGLRGYFDSGVASEDAYRFQYIADAEL